MTIMVDASAIVAIVRGEPDANLLLSALGSDNHRMTNGIAIWESARAVARGGFDGLEASLAEVERYCRDFAITIIPIAGAEAAEAIRAQHRYGKGSGHPARLNMGDCFAYACAKNHHARLLYKGNDFVHTDLG